MILWKLQNKKTKELSHWLTFFLIAVNMYFIIYSPFTVTIQYQMCVVPQLKTVPNKCILLLLKPTIPSSYRLQSHRPRDWKPSISRETCIPWPVGLLQPTHFERQPLFWRRTIFSITNLANHTNQRLSEVTNWPPGLCDWDFTSMSHKDMTTLW